MSSFLCYCLEYAGKETGFVVQKTAWGYHAFPSQHMLFDSQPLKGKLWLSHQTYLVWIRVVYG